MKRVRKSYTPCCLSPVFRRGDVIESLTGNIYMVIEDCRGRDNTKVVKLHYTTGILGVGEVYDYYDPIYWGCKKIDATICTP